MSKADWAGANLPTMWNSAQAADTQMAWQQVTAWQRTYDLLLHHEGRLKACRDELTYAWPPDRSPAATAFVEYIDGLLISIGRAKQDAVENHRALALVLTSLSATKSDMAKLKAEWDQHEAEDANMAANLPNDLFASGENWQETLNEKARVRMAQDDQEVFEAKQKMVDITPAMGEPIYAGEPFDPYSRSTGPGASSNGSRSGTTGSSSWMYSPSIPPVPTSDPGAGLAGGAIPDTNRLPGQAPPGASGAGQGPSRNAVSAPPALAPVGRNLPTSSFGRDVAVPGRTSVATGVGRVVGRRVPASPTEGAIPREAGMARQPRSTRVGPVGGVINGMGTGSSAPMTSMGRTSASNIEDREPMALLQWEVAEGGTPIIEPAPERPFELGPGVIGADRV